jgi:hypothetical protein
MKGHANSKHVVTANGVCQNGYEVLQIEDATANRTARSLPTVGITSGWCTSDLGDLHAWAS